MVHAASRSFGAFQPVTRHCLEDACRDFCGMRNLHSLFVQHLNMEVAPSLQPYIAADPKMEEEVEAKEKGEKGLSVAALEHGSTSCVSLPQPPASSREHQSLKTAPPAATSLPISPPHPAHFPLLQTPSPAPPPRDDIHTTQVPAPPLDSDTEHLRPVPPLPHPSPSHEIMADNQVKEGDQGMLPLPAQSRTRPAAWGASASESLHLAVASELLHHASIGLGRCLVIQSCVATPSQP